MTPRKNYTVVSQDRPVVAGSCPSSGRGFYGLRPGASCLPEKRDVLKCRHERETQRGGAVRPGVPGPGRRGSVPAPAGRKHRRSGPGRLQHGHQPPGGGFAPGLGPGTHGHAGHRPGGAAPGPDGGPRRSGSGPGAVSSTSSAPPPGWGGSATTITPPGRWPPGW